MQRIGKQKASYSSVPSEAQAPHPPFLEIKKQFRPLPKMRAFFHSGEVFRETRLRAAQRVGSSDKWGYVEIELGPLWIFFAPPSTLFEGPSARRSTEVGTLLGLPSASAHHHQH